MQKIALIVEKDPENRLWGRVTFDEDLIIDEASSLPLLERKMKNLVHGFHDLPVETFDFDILYDLTALFSEKKYLNLSEVATKIGINRSLMAQYASGKKFPSLERAKQIEQTIHSLGRDLLEVKLALKGKRLKTSRAVSAVKKPKRKTKV